ncbi:hypothetical protein PIIN_00285 [Serendipita indica DSM 11827]|uniref:Uncharacterized protein n=1 Tax=Serendipita indica (strain DSM 11827) TaxID=1109443 RepID=G4T5I4_SERID|nr:hypothetical protein PIIN_00285 [Serendipita indica DSM 11827]
MSVTLVVPREYGVVVAVGLSTVFLASYHGFVTSYFRRRANIRHPQCYADPKQMSDDINALKFTCAQRAHQNMLETLPIILFGIETYETSLAWSGLYYPVTTSALGVGWIISMFDFRHLISTDWNRSRYLFERIYFRDSREGDETISMVYPIWLTVLQRLPGFQIASTFLFCIVGLGLYSSFKTYFGQW